MLNSLQYKVLVEGVDNLAYIPLMEDMGISAYQGFLFEKPIPYDQFHLQARTQFNYARRLT